MISTAKQQVERLLRDLPDDCSVEDVQYHLYVIEKINNRLRKAEAGEFIPHNDVERRLVKWLIA